MIKYNKFSEGKGKLSSKIDSPFNPLPSHAAKKYIILPRTTCPKTSAYDWGVSEGLPHAHQLLLSMYLGVLNLEYHANYGVKLPVEYAVG